MTACSPKRFAVLQALGSFLQQTDLLQEWRDRLKLDWDLS